MATGTPSTVSAPAFHADDPEQTGDYRTLSVPAIISLVFGLAAPLALASPLLLVIPLFGIAVSILALRHIAQSGGTLSGRLTAMIGLMLCIASAVAPTSRDLIFRAMRTSEANEIAKNWLEIVTAGDSERAFRMTADGIRGPRQIRPDEPVPKTTPYQAFLDDPPVKALKEVGPQAQIRFVDSVSYEAATYRNITVKERFSVSSASGHEPVDVIVTAQRTQMPGESMSRWVVTHCEDANAKANANPGT